MATPFPQLPHPSPHTPFTHTVVPTLCVPLPTPLGQHVLLYTFDSPGTHTLDTYIGFLSLLVSLCPCLTFSPPIGPRCSYSGVTTLLVWFLPTPVGKQFICCVTPFTFPHILYCVLGFVSCSSFHPHCVSALHDFPWAMVSPPHTPPPTHVHGGSSCWVVPPPCVVVPLPTLVPFPTRHGTLDAPPPPGCCSPGYCSSHPTGCHAVVHGRLAPAPAPAPFLGWVSGQLPVRHIFIPVGQFLAPTVGLGMPTHSHIYTVVPGHLPLPGYFTQWGSFLGPYPLYTPHTLCTFTNLFFM